MNIDGTTPTIANEYAGGSSSAVWNSVSNSAVSYLDANGAVGLGQNSVLLPFTPESGYVYTLTASVTVPAMSPGKWITLGFAAHDPANSTTPRFNDSAVNGNPWTYLTEGSGGDFFFPLIGTSIGNAQLMPAPGTYTVQLKLDTTGADWTASEFIDGTQIGTNYVYATTPTITAVGVGQTSRFPAPAFNGII